MICLFRGDIPLSQVLAIDVCGVGQNQVLPGTIGTQIGRQYEIKNKAAIALHCKLNGKQIAALLFIPCSSLI